MTIITETGLLVCKCYKKTVSFWKFIYYK